LNSTIVSIFRLKDGEEFQATEISDFIDKETYHIRTDIDGPGIICIFAYIVFVGPSSFATMDEFYDSLLSTGLNQNQVDRIRVVFEQQEILVSQLPRLTDAKLEADGITQRGLREAILAVLGL
jgi:hypothetical protein